jgi:signal transduction histidine kinase
MHERAEAVGARQRIESAPGRGTRVTVEVPRVVALQEAPAQV